MSVKRCESRQHEFLISIPGTRLIGLKPVLDHGGWIRSEYSWSLGVDVFVVVEDESKIILLQSEQ